MNIVFDWDGTLAKKEIAEVASIRRSKMLGEEFDAGWLKAAMKDDSHFVANKELIKAYTGVKDKGLQTEIMTNLFQYQYLGVANEMQDNCLFPRILSLLKDLIESDKNLFIATTLRKDIVEPVLKNLNLEKYFVSVIGNDARLTMSKQDMLEELQNKYEKIHYMIGDKPSDVDAGLQVSAKGVLVTWGTHESYDAASLTVKTVSELRKELL